MNGIVIKNGLVLTMHRTYDVIKNGAVVIEGTRIIAVGTTEDAVGHYPCINMTKFCKNCLIFHHSKRISLQNRGGGNMKL